MYILFLAWSRNCGLFVHISGSRHLLPDRPRAPRRSPRGLSADGVSARSRRSRRWSGCSRGHDNPDGRMPGWGRSSSDFDGGVFSISSVILIIILKIDTLEMFEINWRRHPHPPRTFSASPHLFQHATADPKHRKTRRFPKESDSTNRTHLRSLVSFCALVLLWRADPRC